MRITPHRFRYLLLKDHSYLTPTPETLCLRVKAYEYQKMHPPGLKKRKKENTSLLQLPEPREKR